MNVPQLRFSEFDGEWEHKTIKELGIIGRGMSKHRPRNDSRLYGTEYPFVQTSDIKHAGLYLNSYTQAYSEFGLKQSKLWPNGTLCITIAANIAETTILDIEACFPDSIIGFTPDSTKSEVVFIKKYFEFINPKLQKMSEGIAQSNLNLEKLASIEFTVPSIQEQKKIATFFTLVEKMIEKQQEKIEKLEQFKKGMMQKIFSQELRFKDEDGGEFPEWESKRLADTGQIVTGNTPSKSVETYWNEPLLPWITPSDINENKDIFDSQSKLSEEGYKKARRLPANTLLVTCIASIGKNTILKVEGSCNQQINAIIPNEYHDVDFLYYLIEHFNYRIKGIAGKTATAIVNKTTFENLIFLMPLYKEQLEVSTFLSSLDKKVEKVKEKLMVLEEQKRGFMWGMFV